MQTGKFDIVLIGSGNVATQLGIALQKRGFPILQICGHTQASTSALAKRLHVPYTCTLSEVDPNASIYIFAVKDDVLPALLETFPVEEGLWLHTAGSVPMSIFNKYTKRCGVLYPLQTFSKERDTHFDHIPILIEANNPSDEELLRQLAGTLSDKVETITSEQRKYYHLAAVFACNFSNHMYVLAEVILEKQQLNWKNLLPLIRETASKITELNPREAQTGPAVRYDEKIIDKHLEMLQGDPVKQKLYQLISENIHIENNLISKK